MGKRRDNGEGSICKVSENKWVAKIALGSLPDGRVKVKQFSGKTETIVKKKLQAFKRTQDYQLRYLPTGYTVEQYVRLWLQNVQYGRLKPASYDRLESTVEHHVIPYFGRCKLDSVTGKQIQKLVNYMDTDLGLSYSSIKKVYTALNACYKYAVAEDAVIKNPCLNVTLPAQDGKKVIPFTEEETALLTVELTRTDENGIPLHYYGEALLLILHTGLRMGEALSLQWSDVDWRKHRISVRKTNTLVKKRNVLGTWQGGYELRAQNSPKTASGFRTVPINQTAEAVLRRLERRKNSPLVIANCRGRAVLPSNFERAFHAILKDAALPQCGVHTLRHTFASLLFKRGVDIKVVSHLLGHSSVKVTYDIYVHLFQDELAGATRLLD